MNKMYHRKPQNNIQPRPTTYNTPRLPENEKKQTPVEPTQTIKILREAHVTEITLGNQTLRVMDAGHIQGVINMMEKHDSSIKQINKTVGNLNRSIGVLSQQITSLKAELDEIKGKLNGNFL